MGAVKGVFGVVLLAVAIYLLERIVSSEIALAVWAVLLLVSAVYLGAFDALPATASGWRRLWKGTGLVMSVYSVLLIVGIAGGGGELLQPLKGLAVVEGTAKSHGLTFKRIKGVDGLRAELQAATAQNRSVMLDFYADWCISCKEMEKFTFSDDGRYVFGSSYYTGVSNIFRYEIETKELEAVSNAETGFFRPIPLDDGDLIIFEYTGTGFVPTRIDPVPLEHVSNIRFLGTEIVKKHPVVRDWVVGSPRAVELDPLVTHRGKYRPASELGFSTAYPIIEGYRDYEAFGWHFRFSDPA